MSTTVLTDSIVVNTAAAAETVTTKLTAAAAETVTTKLTAAAEVDLAKCNCCGLIEECTPAYIKRIRERYNGKWICGLCAEAVKDETMRCEERFISAEEALTRHFNFCMKFRSAGPPPDPTVHLIAAMRRILRRRLEPPEFTSSMPSSPMRNGGGGGGDEISIAALKRSESCIPTISLVEVNCSVEMQQRCE